MKSILDGSCDDYVLWNGIPYKKYDSDMLF